MVDTFSLSHIICPHCEVAANPETYIEDYKDLPLGCDVHRVNCEKCGEKFDIETFARKKHDISFETYVLDNDL